MMAQTLTGRAAQLEDVAALAGVSLATASKALHNKPRISEETKQRVPSDGVRHDTWSMPSTATRITVSTTYPAALSSANPPSRWTDINRYPTASWFYGPLSRCR